MSTTRMQHDTSDILYWLRDVRRSLPERYYMIRDDIDALDAQLGHTIPSLRYFAERLVFRLSAQLELGGDSLDPLVAESLRQAHTSAVSALRACDYAVVNSEPHGLDTLDALDLAYLISTCELPRAYYVWGERAQAAHDQAVKVIDAFLPDGYDDRWTVAEYGEAGRRVFNRKGYTWGQVMGA